MKTIIKNTLKYYPYTVTYTDEQTGKVYEKVTKDKDISIEELKKKPTYVYTIKEVSINEIRQEDTIIHSDIMRTVGKNNIGGDPFTGKTLFGDSYNSGHKLVKKLTFVRL